MNTRSIAFHIEKKIDHWIESLGPGLDKKEIKDNVIVSGGCIVSMLLDEDIHDYDIYFRTHKAAKAIAEYYVAEFTANPPEGFKDTLVKNMEIKVQTEPRIKIDVKMKESKVQMFSQEFNDWLERVLFDRTKAEDKDPYRPLYLSSNAISLSDQVQLIIRFQGKPDKIHENYDFTHCKNYWTAETGLVLNHKALESIITKDLHYEGSLYPVCSVFRVRKFLNRGWKITAGQLLKAVLEINKLDLDNFDVLEDQLIGVDSAEFGELIEKMKQKGEKLTKESIYQLIDEVF